MVTQQGQARGQEAGPVIATPSCFVIWGRLIERTSRFFPPRSDSLQISNTSFVPYSHLNAYF